MSSAETIFFNHLSEENGLSQVSVNSIYQDEFGVFWIGTRYGLNKYDGNKIEVFKHNPSDKNSLFGNNIQTVCGDQNGNIFIQCRAGLVVYDMVVQKMTTVTQNDVVGISYGYGRLWSCSNSSVSYYDKNTNRLVEFARLPDPKFRIGCIREASTGLLYIGTKNAGLIVMDKNKRFANSIPNVEVVSIYEDSKQRIWVATRLDGLFIIERNNHITHLTHNQSDANSIPHNYVRTICEDDFGNFWIGTLNGLCRYNIAQNKFTTFNHSESKPYSIGNSSVWCLHKDKQGTIWIGSFYGGIDYFNPEYSFFKFFSVDNGKGYSLSYPIAGRMIEDNHNNLWVGTEGGGLNCLNLSTGGITIYNNLPSYKNISVNAIKALWVDTKNNNLWIGTHIEGLYRMNMSTRQTTVFRNNPNDPGSLKNDYIRGIVEYKNKLYMGTHNSVVVLDLETLKSSFLLDNKKFGLENRQIWNIMLDKSNKLWFSTSSAIYRYNFDRKTLTRYIHSDADPHSIGSTYLNTFCQDSKGRIWLGSAGSGLALYNPKTDNFTSFNSMNSNIIDDYVLDIKESASGYLIIATNKGFSFFDSDNNMFYNFYNQSVFPITAINDGALYVTRDGEIFIGCTNGLFAFRENILNLQSKPYKLFITDLYVNNERITPSKKSILKKSIQYTDRINLKHNQNTIALEFSSSNYIRAVKNIVEYTLTGFDKTWITSNNRHLITYTNLNPGDYELKIRVKQRDNIIAQTSLKIHIRSPFYATWYAYLFYIIVITLISYTIIRSYTSGIRLKMSLDYEKKEKERIEAMNQSKLRFFTNISHEFRTPITLILSQMESILQSTSIQNSLYNKMQSVHKNTLRMGKLINELLDFRKQEQGYLQIRVSQQDIIAFLNEIILTFKEYAAHKQINFSFLHSESCINLWFDTNQMEKVFYNLLSNAFKFTPVGGDICISVTVEGVTVVIDVSDSGSNINEKDIDKIFDRFYQAENGYNTGTGTGIGLALAKGIVDLHHGTIKARNLPEGGCRFSVSMPIGDDHFSEEQKATPDLMNPNNINFYPVPDEAFMNEIMESQRQLSEQKSRILLVEDNAELLDLLVQIFKPLYEVTTAVNGADAFEKAIQQQPDIIVSDIMMPVMSGTELCSKIKSNLETCHIPVVLLTARTTIEYTIEGFRMGADDYLTKPFNTRLLIIRCNNLVNNRKQLQAKFSKQSNNDIELIATNSLDQQFMSKAIGVVEKMLDNSAFDVNQFASEMLMGRTAFFHKLKGITGQTPNEFITNIRLKKSLQLLVEQPEMSITDIGYELGFSSPSYFTKCFREVFGVTPAKYRKDNLTH
jgi:signal transduction histidine kinase/ligand-binding sensor domain-containing protein/DNA-binding response OmpR family regulator